MSVSKTKVAIYSGVIPSTTFIERLIEGMATQNLEILLFGGIKNKKDYAYNIRCLGYRNSRIYKAFYLFYYTVLLTIFKNSAKRKLDRLLKSESKSLRRAKLNAYPVLWYHPDIFHVQWAKSLNEWMWLKDFDIKIVLSLRGAHINYSPIADNDLAENYKKNFPKVDAFHAVSNAIAEEATKYGADPQKTKVIYSGMNLNMMDKDIHRNEILKIVSIGRAHWKKGFTYALDACKLLKDEGVAFHYTIVGAKDEIELQYQQKDLGLENDVVLERALPFNEVLQLIKSSDLLLLSSTEEGIANVVVEAMFIETLVLSTDCGGMNELIEDGKNGFLVPIRDANALATKIKSINSLSKEEIATIIANAKNDVEEKHSMQSMIKDMSALYGKVISTEDHS